MRWDVEVRTEPISASILISNQGRSAGIHLILNERDRDRIAMLNYLQLKLSGTSDVRLRGQRVRLGLKSLLCVDLIIELKVSKRASARASILLI